jgi:hypothetical protein
MCTKGRSINLADLRTLLIIMGIFDLNRLKNSLTSSAIRRLTILYINKLSSKTICVHLTTVTPGRGPLLEVVKKFNKILI